MKVWVWRYQDKDGCGGEITTRGPNTVEELHDTQRHLLGQMALRAVQSGAADPELRVVEEREEGASDAGPGEWRPANARPIDLGQYARREAEALDEFELD